MPQERKRYHSSEQLMLKLQVQGLANPEIASYISSLKRKFAKYAMPADEARKIVDAAMGKKTLTELLYEAREQAG